MLVVIAPESFSFRNERVGDHIESLHKARICSLDPVLKAGRVMKKLFTLLLGVLALCWLALPQANAAPYGGVNDDTQLLKAMPWRAKVPWLPGISLGYGVGFVPAWFSPANAAAAPYVSGGLSVGLGWSLAQFGVTGYWRDLSLSAGWGLSTALSDNFGGGQYARQTYSRDVGVSLGKTLFVEKNTGIRLRMGVGFKIPASLRSRQSTLITSIAPRLNLSKSFFGRVTLSYGFGMNFNFFVQDSGVYNPDFAGIPRLNNRWGMSHSFGLGIGIIRNLSVRAGVSIGVGYSFADAYTTTDGPQVFGGENLSAADLASYAINEGNSYSLALSILEFCAPT